MVARIPDQRKPQSNPATSRRRDPWTDHPCADCAKVGACPDDGRGLISIDTPAVLHRCRRRAVTWAVREADEAHLVRHNTHFRERLPFASEIRELRLSGFNVPASGRGLRVEVHRLADGAHCRTFVRRGSVVWQCCIPVRATAGAAR